MDTMSPLDALFLHVEDGVTHMHIGSVAIFDGPPPPFESIVALVEAKLPRLHRYRQRVRFVPGSLGRPVWVDDPHFNVRYHVRHTALPAPGGPDDLRNLMGRLMSQELDRQRPLWEAWIVEGLGDGFVAGSWAMISKVHHCMVDGIAGTDLMAVMLDADPAAPVEPAPDAWAPEPEPSDAQLVRGSLVRLATSPFEQVRAARSMARAPRAVGDALAATMRGAASYGRHLRPTTALSIEGTIGPHRRWTWITVELADVAVVRHALGGTVNDVVLALATRGFRELLLARGDDADHATLRTLVPMSVRDPHDHRPNNQVTALVAELPVHLSQPLDRFAAVRAAMIELKGSHQAEAGMALTALGDLAPPALVAGTLRGATALLRRLPQRSVNTVTTNVPGPREELFCLGRAMREYVPFVPLASGVRVGVAMLSYHGRIAFGITGDWDSIDDLTPMTDGIRAELDALLSASTPAPARRSRKRATATR
jgi:diacylglycerol O-acyltransferase